MLHAIDLDGETYMRSEGGSLLVGVCKDLSERCFARTRVANLKGIAIADEQDCRPWAADGSPWDYGENELLEPDLERISPELIKAYERYPCMNDVGLKVQLNGPFTFSPDGNPLVGPVEGTGLAMRHGSNARSNGPPAPDGDGDVHNFWAACAVMAGFSQGTFETFCTPVHPPVQTCLAIH